MSSRLHIPAYPMDQALRTTDDVVFSTIDTGQGATEVHAMDQSVQTTDAVTFATVDTGQGANELHPMDQGVQTTDSPSFNGLTVNGTADFRYQTTHGVTSNTTISAANQIVGVDTSGGTVTITLASSIVAAGAWVTVNDEGGSAGSNAITIDTESSETIDGSSSISIGSSNGTAKVYSDGTNWFTI